MHCTLRIAHCEGDIISDDLQNLLLPISKDATWYRLIYAYGNHIKVRGAQVDLSICDSGVPTTFLQSCCSSSSNMNMRTTNLKYVKWVEEIISVDYEKFHVVVLYCTWALVNRIGALTTVKYDKYGFTLQI